MMISPYLTASWTNFLPDAVAVQAEQPRRIYQVGGYARLSVEDSGKPGADTISTQRELIQSYIDGQPDMRLYDLYCDNGRTGTNFAGAR